MLTVNYILIVLVQDYRAYTTFVRNTNLFFMDAQIHEIQQRLVQLRKTIVLKQEALSATLEKVHPNHELSAKNLLQYLALRSEDIRELQEMLHASGLSSLSSAESHLLGQIESILGLLERKPYPTDAQCTYRDAKFFEQRNRKALLGVIPDGQTHHLMVTLDSAWLKKPAFFDALLQEGMTLARINCAHDTPALWDDMIHAIKRSSEHLQKPCKIYMDLAGPKIRTVLKKNKPITVKKGQKLYLTASTALKKNRLKKVIGCTLGEIIPQLKLHDRVMFDDGKMGARVVEVLKDEVKIEMTHVPLKKPVLKPEKGINFPDTDVQIQALTPYDLSCLSFISERADVFGYSFVKSSSDIKKLVQSFEGLPMPPVVLKIETVQAVYELPSLLLEVMKMPVAGIMIARGDLAVEIGFEKLSEIQEEILWICEAAHTPVIWATQVLESLNKTGLATRAEITDVSHASGADCIMINKGTYVVEVLQTLTNVLKRMDAHHLKKRFVFRPLGIASMFYKDGK